MKYVVRSGDTLSAIAQKYGTTVTGIMNCNKTLIKDANCIEVGWEINIPSDAEFVTADTNKTPDYTAIGKQVEKCLKDIQQLTSYTTLLTLLN